MISSVFNKEREERLAHIDGFLNRFSQKKEQEIYEEMRRRCESSIEEARQLEGFLVDYPPTKTDCPIVSIERKERYPIICDRNCRVTYCTPTSIFVESYNRYYHTIRFDLDTKQFLFMDPLIVQGKTVFFLPPDGDYEEDDSSISLQGDDDFDDEYARNCVTDQVDRIHHNYKRILFHCGRDSFFAGYRMSSTGITAVCCRQHGNPNKKYYHLSRENGYFIHSYFMMRGELFILMLAEDAFVVHVGSNTRFLLDIDHRNLRTHSSVVACDDYFCVYLNQSIEIFYPQF